MNGILNINKPYGLTSYRVVSLVKRLSKEKRVGHAGTLDPAATGVLPVCLGQGTRIIEFLMDTTKAYRAEIELGIETDTYDAVGRVTQRGDASGISREQVDSALASFHGQIDQTAPVYSALKYQGQPMYELARAGVSVRPKSRLVNIHSIDVIDWQPPVVTIDVVCGKGTYIRSLAHDLGQKLGCGAHLKSLVRTRCGIFDITAATSVTEMETAFRSDDWQRFLYPIDSVLQDLPAIVLGEKEADHIRNGRPFTLESDANIIPAPKGKPSRAYAPDGRFLAILSFNSETGQWRPEKVFLQ